MLNAHEASFERATEKSFAIDVESGGDYEAVRAQVESRQRDFSIRIA